MSAERHHTLDLLRGLAAIGIASYHYLSVEAGVTLYSLGTFGVYVFFVLSALTLMMVYAPSFKDALEPSRLGAFYWHRVSRIAPLLMAVAAVSFVWASVPAATFSGVAAHALQAFLTGSGLFALSLPGFLSNSTGAWSLGIEIWFYLLFPLLCLLAMHVRLRSLLAVCAVFLVAQHAALLLIRHGTVGEPQRLWHYYTTPLTFAPFFLFGLAIYRAGRRPIAFALPIWLLLLLPIAFGSVVFDVDVLQSSGAYLCLTGLAAAAVFFAYNCRLPPGAAPVAALLGEISYALYLTHPFALVIARGLARRLAIVPLEPAVFAVVAFAIAYLTFRCFERPVRRYLRSVADPGHRPRLGVPVQPAAE